MADKFPRDQFDDLVVTTGRHGAHRAPRRKGAGWIAFAWAALATFVLIIAGVGTLVVTSSSISLKDFESIFVFPEPTPSPTPKPTAEPTVDPASLVNILNATGTEGVATAMGDILAADGWTVGAKTNASQVVEKTVAYYLNPTLEGAARGVIASLGYGEIELSDRYIESSAQITLVIGQDYVKKSLQQ